MLVGSFLDESGTAHLERVVVNRDIPKVRQFGKHLETSDQFLPIIIEIEWHRVAYGQCGTTGNHRGHILDHLANWRFADEKLAKLV